MIYLHLNTPAEREYAAKHAVWLRGHAEELRARYPDKAEEFQAEALELEAVLAANPARPSATG
jgi:hypothetical protein